MIDFMQMNGFNSYVVSSEENTDRLIRAFKDEIRKGNNPNDIQEEVYDRLKIYPEDLTDTDLRRFKRTIEQFCRKSY